MNSTIRKLRDEVGALTRNSLGRRRYSPELRARLGAALSEWTASGKSIVLFARAVDVNPQLLVRWQQDKKAQAPSPVREVAVSAEPARSSSLRLVFPCGAAVEGLSMIDVVEYSRAQSYR